MSSVIESYKKQSKKKKDGDVMGLIRALFPDTEVESFIKSRQKKVKKT